MKSRVASRRILFLLLLLALLGGCGLMDVGASESAGGDTVAAAVANEDAVVLSIREGLKGHAQRIHVRLPYSVALEVQLSALAADWMERALAETDDPAEGDYLRCQTGGYEATAARETDGGRELLSLTITPKYYLYLAQEEEAEAALREALAGLPLAADASEEARVRAVYDYICGNVAYDAVHRDNPHATLRSTMYAALVGHRATCQGYAVTIYRMLRELGVPCRVVTGTAARTVAAAAGQERTEEVFHAWNIVCVDGVWYGLDATWDAGATTYRWFLCPLDAAAGGFVGHVPASRTPLF